jgi:hypothetical protein
LQVFIVKGLVSGRRLARNRRLREKLAGSGGFEWVASEHMGV